MAFSVQMPALGESVTEGTVTRWLKQEGDTVAVDEPLVEVSTDKVDTEIPSPAAGVLQKIVAAEDETVEVGAELAVIGDADDSDDSADADDSADSDDSDDAEGSPKAEPEPDDAVVSDDTSDAEPAPAKPSGDTGGDDSGGGGDGTSVTMPALGESVTEGTVTRWLKAVGDEVAVDEPLLEVSTDKVDTEIPSPVAGTLLKISADEDETIEVGGELAVIGAKGASAPARTAAPEPEQTQSADGDSGTGNTGDTGDDADSGHSAEPQTEKSGRDDAPVKTPLEEEADTDAAAREQAAEREKPAKASGEKAASSTSGGEKPSPSQPAPAGGSAGEQGRHRGSDAPAPYVTPLVRKLAADKDVDLSALTGTGVGGRIRKQDVEAAAEKAAQAKAEPAPEQATAAPAPSSAARTPSSPAGVRPELAALRGTTKKASRIRQITAIKTRESLQSTAQLTQTFEVDMSRVAALRKRAKASFAEQEGVNLTYLPFFAKAVVEALKSHPNVNASYDEAAKEITYHGAEHLSIAVDTPAGLLSPVIHNAGDLSLAGLARAIADLAARARSNGLKPDELSGGTFTITNIGSQGALFDTPILVPPQAAMLGTGAIVKRPVVVSDDLGSDSIAVRSMCYLPLTYDHRLVDGADAGRFLTTLKHRLEEAAFEADLGL